PGLAIFEVQQNSDTTWRIHDWGRGRPVHLAQARQAARSTTGAGAGAGAWQSLLATDAFTLRAARVSGRQALGVPRRYALLTVLEGHGRLSQVGRPEGRLELAPGDTVFVHEPAVLEGEALSVLVVDPP
ncbi:MAG TPA: hypothetical protein VFF36_06965, partial [Planctomycetota bacterium]|nr:hypothetical protein [Planctomycetota bacterium]